MGSRRSGFRRHGHIFAMTARRICAIFFTGSAESSEGLPAQQSRRVRSRGTASIIRTGRGDPEDIAGYLASHYEEGRPTVGMIFYRSEWIMGDFTYHTALVRAIEAEGMNAVAVFSNSYRDERVESPTLMDAIRKYFCRMESPLST